MCCPIRIASPRRVEPGDPLIADIVVRADGYWGDTAETHVSGSNAEVEEARAKLLEILESARTELSAGNTGAAIFAAMDARVREAFPDGELPHHGGHALGLTSFEDPHVIPSDETTLESWMVIALEPGVYVPGRFGARVENVFVVTPAGGLELRERDGDRPWLRPRASITPGSRSATSIARSPSTATCSASSWSSSRRSRAGTSAPSSAGPMRTSGWRI